MVLYNALKCIPDRVSKMARMNLTVNDELKAEFEEVVFNTMGMKKGNVTKAVQEALREWIKKNA